MKKLLGLLAVAPMAITACGGEETPFDAKTHKEATSYAAVSGNEILNGEYEVGKDYEVNNTLEQLGHLMGGTALNNCGEFSVDDFAILEIMINAWVGENGYSITKYTDITTLGLNDNEFYDGSLIPGDQGYRPPCVMSEKLEYTLTPTATTYTNANVGKVTAGINAADQITELTFDETKSVQSNTGDSFKGQEYVAREVYVADDADKYGYRALTEADVTKFETAFLTDVTWEATDAVADSDWSKTVKAIENKMVGMNLATATKYAEGLSKDNYNYQYALMVVEALEAAIASDPITEDDTTE